MKKCNYLGRICKENHESCSGCNAFEFTKIEDFKKMVITALLIDGYK